MARSIREAIKSDDEDAALDIALDEVFEDIVSEPAPPFLVELARTLQKRLVEAAKNKTSVN